MQKSHATDHKPQADGLVPFEAQLVETLPNLRAFARFLTGSRDQADDLVNETILRALAARSQFQPGTNLKAWLFAILRNQHINEFRRRKVTVEPLDQTNEISVPTPAGQIASIELGEVRSALGKMSHQHREVLILVAAAGLSYEEAADICKCAVGTVKSRLNRARTELKELLEQGSHLPPTERRGPASSS